MIHKNIAVFLILATLIAMSFSVSAEDEDLRSLVKAMSVEMAELAKQVKESNKRIGELESKLAQIEQAQPPVATAVSVKQPASSQVVTVASGSPTVAASQEQSKVAPVVTVGDVKGTFKIPGTDTSLGVGGYVKLDANYSSIGMGGDKWGDQHLVVAQIPVGEDRLGQHSKNTFHAKESRFWLKSFTPSAWGDINTFLELDFLGAPEISNYTPRLRHAYGSIGNFLAGQTWTTFLNTNAIPDTLDPVGPVGSLLYIRQPQVRWTQPFKIGSEPFELHAALETPKSRLWATSLGTDIKDAYGFINPNDERYPDFIARLNYIPEWGTLSLAGMVRQIRYSRQASVQQDESWGGAVSLAGKINTWGTDNLRFMLNYGNAIGRYATFNAFEDAALDANGQLQLLNIYSAMLAYQHWWNNAWRSTLAYGFVKADQPSYVQTYAPALAKDEMMLQAQSLHANLLWNPLPQFTIGLEYIYALRERVDGQDGDLHRMQFSTRFNF